MRFSWFSGGRQRPRRGSAARRRASAAPLAVRRLERRRVLDANITSLAIPAVVAEGDTVSSSATGTGTGTLSFEWSVKQGFDTIASGSGPVFDFVAPDDGTYDVMVQLFDSAQTSDVETRTLVVTNVEPSIDSLAIITPIDENGTTTLSGTYSDRGPLDTHELDIDWNGDDVFDETVTVSGGSFAIEHLFLDDDPTATPTDTFNINVRLRDDDGGNDIDSVGVIVNNVAPQIANLDATDVDENGFAALTANIVDPGTQDTFMLEVDWGDGTIEMFSYAAGTTVHEAHQYLDDNPSGTPSDSYTIRVTVVDDDTGSGFAETTILVSNVAPMLGQDLSATSTSENGTTTLSGSIIDSGSQDTFTLEVDWGDGTTETFTYGAGTTGFSETHQYLDDNPTGTASDPYVISVTLRDDDLGAAVGTTTIVVGNVAPTIEGLGATDVAENGVTTLSGNIVDPGTQDTFTLEVDWGDGVVETFTYAAGATSFSETHQYLDDDPTGTASDPRTISVTLVDDDKGEYSEAVTITISNVAPAIEDLAATNIPENGATILTGNIVDPGTQDTFTLEVDWGDGTTETFTYGAGTTSFSETHQYLDDDPTDTASDSYTISVEIVDDDTGADSDSVSIVVSNVAPILGQDLAATSTSENGTTTLTGSIIDPGTNDTFTLEVDWGDGTIETFAYGAGTTSFSETHQYLDDDPTGTSSDSYTITLKLTDDDGGMDSSDVAITVSNVAPVLTVVDNQVGNEGQLVDLSGAGGAPPLATFTDVGTLDTHAATIDWGDGVSEAGTIVQGSGDGSVGGSHTYADDGTYTVTVTLVDDDGESDVQTFLVTVNNVAPSLTVVGPQSVDEGALIALSNLGTITDPGFDNPANLPSGSVESFSFWINWGDGTGADAGSAMIDDIGGVMDLTDASFDGSHIFADNGTYTVTVRVADDDMTANFEGGVVGVDFVEMIFTVTVNNVDPFLTGIEGLQVDEGEAFVLTSDGDDDTVNLGVGLADPGFANPANPLSQPGGSVETFTSYTIDWGDGTAQTGVAIANFEDGGPGVLTTAGFDHAAHTYADNGVYTVQITTQDDDGPVVTRALTITVNNVAPTLTVGADQTIDESETIMLTDIGTFTDPGFNNPLNVGNVANGGEAVETFTFSVDWGDGIASDTGSATIDALGSVGNPTAGSFDGTHTYADNGVYTVSVTVTDDDLGSHTVTFVITVNNVAPQFEPIDGIPFQPNDDRFEGTDVTAEGFTTIRVAFSDPGYDNPLNAGNVANGGETAETFTYLVNWGDGTVDTVEVVFVAPGVPLVVNAQTSVLGSLRTAGDATTLTTGAFEVTHRYLGPPNPQNPTAPIVITLTLMDDDGGAVTADIEVRNPGIETVNVAIDTTPDVPRLDSTPPPAAGVFIASQNTSTQSRQTLDATVASSELVATAERYLELRVVYPDGTEGEGYRLKDEVLLDLRGLFASLPDGRYRIYLVRTENNFRRLVMEVDVRNGRLIDTSDDSEGTRDRPPTSEAVEEPETVPLDENPLLEEPPANQNQPNETPAGETDSTGGEASEGESLPDSEGRMPLGGGNQAFGEPLPMAAERHARWGAPLVGVGLAAVAWSTRVDAALKQADEEAWRRLRYAGQLGRVFRRQDAQATSSTTSRGKYNEA